MSNRKVILYISMSVDGFLATKDDDLSWLSVVEKDGEDYGYGAFVENIDSYIVGRKTYETVLKMTGGSFPQTEMFKECFIITRQDLKDENCVKFYNGDIEELVTELKSQEGKNIYCDGGAEIVKLLMEKDLIDEYVISVIPIILGDGKKLFKGGVDRLKLEALPSKQFESGLVQLHYIRK